MGLTNYKNKHTPEELVIKEDELVAKSDKTAVEITERCDKCGDFLSLDRRDYQLKQATCRRGCCDYGWRVGYTGDTHIGLDTFCKDCFENREELYKDKLHSRIKGTIKSLQREIDDLSDRISRLENKKEKKLLRQNTLINSTEDFLENKEITKHYNFEIPNCFKGEKIEELYDKWVEYSNK